MSLYLLPTLGLRTMLWKNKYQIRTPSNCDIWSIKRFEILLPKLPCAILDFQVALCTKEAKYYPGILGIGQKDLFGYMYVQNYQYRVVYQKVDTFEHKIWLVITHNPLCDRWNSVLNCWSTALQAPKSVQFLVNQAVCLYFLPTKLLGTKLLG